MKRFVPWVLLGCCLGYLLFTLKPRVQSEGFNESDFGALPVLAGGRIQPIDSVARNALLIMRGKQTLRTQDGAKRSAVTWLMDVLMNPEVADDALVFYIPYSDVLGLFGWHQSKEKYFSFNQLKPYLQEIERQAQLASQTEAQIRSPFQSNILKLHNGLTFYGRLKHSLYMDGANDFLPSFRQYQAHLESGLQAVRQQMAGKTFDEHAYEIFSEFASIHQFLEERAYLNPIPPEHQTPALDWIPIGESLFHSIHTGDIHPLIQNYAVMAQAYRSGDSFTFNEHLHQVQKWLSTNDSSAVNNTRFEYGFNRYQPFYKCMIFYVLIFILACMSWGWGRQVLNRSAFLLLLLACVVHSLGLVARMVIQGRPPVTNLYSSAIFIGWGSVVLGLVLEKIFRDGIGSACAACIGFITLLIAHHLSGNGDTLEMLRAVLDTNIWLATHVVVITLGYSSTFVAGFLAILYILRGIFTRSFSETTACALDQMVFGIICFAMLFSFVGTMLGGIWADQSWGRFWGWDAKENGALLIVLWNAIILHARLGGFIRQQGLMIMAIFGNVVTSWSWFGVNMLGVGLHSYGFIDKAFVGLATFVVTQSIIMGIGCIPRKLWRSSA